MLVALLSIAPALTPDAVLEMPVGRAFALRAARRRLTKRSQLIEDASGGGGRADGESWTDARGHRHTKIGSMDSLFAMMPRKP